MSVTFQVEDVSFRLRDVRKIRSWIISCIETNKFTLGELSYVFCSDNYLLDINQKYLNHDTFTDIITFDYTEGKLVSADIFISIDRVKENAKLFENPFSDELHRVMIHGVLHLMGHKDKTAEQKKDMRAQEDKCLTLRQF